MRRLGQGLVILAVAARARAVATALEQAGVARARIVQRAASDNEPSLPAGPDGRAPQNRRVVILVY